MAARRGGIEPGLLDGAHQIAPPVGPDQRRRVADVSSGNEVFDQRKPGVVERNEWRSLGGERSANHEGKEGTSPQRAEATARSTHGSQGPSRSSRSGEGTTGWGRASRRHRDLDDAR